MLSPYGGTFRVSQAQTNTHRGIDLVGISDKTIRSTIKGLVVRAGWENEANKKQGYGLRVWVKEDNTNRHFVFAHLSKIDVGVNQRIEVGHKIGVEGNTGSSTGSHLHYEARTNIGDTKSLNIANISGIPNIASSTALKNTPATKLPRNYSVTASLLNVRTSGGSTYQIAKFNADTTINGRKYKKGSLVQYHKGTIVTIYETKNGWGRGVRGWMSMQYLKEV